MVRLRAKNTSQSVQKKAGADALLQSVRVLWFLERQEWGICAFDFFVHAPHYRRPRHAQVDLRLERLAVKGAALRLDSLLVGAEAEQVLVARGLTRARARGAGPEEAGTGRRFAPNSGDVHSLIVCYM